MMALQFDNTGDLLSTELGSIGLTAAGFDCFGLAPVATTISSASKALLSVTSVLYLTSIFSLSTLKIA